MKEQINIEDFFKCDIRVGTILEVHLVEGADKLIRFIVDAGETIIDEEGNAAAKHRQILSGIREYFDDTQTLLGRQVPVLCNLPTRKLRGYESEGMILYTVGEGSDFTTLCPTNPVTNGTEIG
jgi:methionyl-tRNA synthetase